VHCLVGDGECQEGTVWEALVLIARMQLDNLTLVVDANGHQGFSDPTADHLPPSRLRDMVAATGLDVVEVDGHDFEAIHSAYERLSTGARVVLARTVKGKGVSFMEDRFEWHYKSPDADQLRHALEELK
jgi:transketolase